MHICTAAGTETSFKPDEKHFAEALQSHTLAVQTRCLLTENGSEWF